MDRYFQIQHFAHPEHPLILVDLRNKNKQDLSETQTRLLCDICKNDTSQSSAYSCIACGFHLHKLCAKLPTQMIHPLHDPQHPLTLLRPSSSRVREYDPDEDEDERFRRGFCSKNDEVFWCGSCSKEKYGGYRYSCRSCKFDVDVKCATEAQAINHKGHQHALHPFLSTALFKCDACTRKHPAEGLSYRCNTCGFWVHEDCATLPATVKYHRHVHSLSLVVRRSIYDVGDWKGCRLCDDWLIDGEHWKYECVGCEHQVHVNCLATSLIAKRSKVDDDIDLTKVFTVPESFQYHNLVAQMIKHMISYDGSKEKTLVINPDGHLSHFDHKHPLTLTCNLQSKKKGDDDDDMKKKENGIIILCYACVLPISTPEYYTCTTCNNYHLHELCAKLPNELQNYPGHQHPLILTRPDHGMFGSTKCPACKSHINGLAYGCNASRREECVVFAMDVQCLLPPTISHKSHPHPLKLIMDCLDQGCVACPRAYTSMAYGCEECCFYLHSTCALVPITIVHRYDKHDPFVLIQAPIQDGPEEYVCEFCEKDIDPNWWFYHCLSSDVSACVDCISQKQVGDFNPHLSYHSQIHKHTLSFVKNDHTNKGSLCSKCRRSFYLGTHALQCALCNIMFCRTECTQRPGWIPNQLILLEESSLHRYARTGDEDDFGTGFFFNYDPSKGRAQFNRIENYDTSSIEVDDSGSDEDDCHETTDNEPNV